MAKPIEKFIERMQQMPRGFWPAFMALAFFFGRYAWVYAERPAHGREMAAAYGSVGLFYGTPRVDSTGKRLAFAETGNKGYAVFLADTASGHKTAVYEEPANGQMMDANNLLVWPWAPDDSAFLYSMGGNINICDPKLGKSVAEVTVGGNGAGSDRLGSARAASGAQNPFSVTGVDWLSATAFVCLTSDGSLVEIAKTNEGAWVGQPLAFKAGTAARNIIPTNGSASSEARGCSAANAFDGDSATSWTATNASFPAWLQYQFVGPAWAISEYTLVSSTNAESAPYAWELLASNDGQTWTSLDSRTNQPFAKAGEAKHYSIPNQMPYWFYRLQITAAQLPKIPASLAEFQLSTENTVDIYTASREGATQEDAAHAFDSDTRTKWYTGAGPPTGWLECQYGGGIAKVIAQYSLTSANDVPDRDPATWELQGSNDGRRWTTVDRRSNEIFTDRRQEKTYTMANHLPFRAYRLNITADQGSASLNSGGARGATNPGGARAGARAGANAGARIAAGTAAARAAMNAGLQLAELTLWPHETNALPSRSIAPPSMAGWRSLRTSTSFTGAGSNAVTWAERKALWKMDLQHLLPEMVLNLQEPGMPAVSITSFSYSKQTGDYLLSCSEGRGNGNSLWRFNPNGGGNGLTQIGARGAAQTAAWLNGTDGGWVGLSGSQMVALQGGSAGPRRLFANGNMSAFAVAPDGARVFAVGMIDREPSPGIWECAVATGKVRAAVPDADFPSPYAVRIEPVTDSPLNAGGQYTLYLPDDASTHPSRKRPLVIGYTQPFVVSHGVHGRMWIDPLVAGGAFVVIVNRSDWAAGVEQWGEKVTAAYNDLSQSLSFDKDRLFLFAASAETPHISRFVTHSPIQWRGVIIVNPTTGLPDLSTLPLNQPKPRFLLSSGDMETYYLREVEEFQANALIYGASVEVAVSPGEAHHFLGNASQLQRTEAIEHFVFEE